MPDDDVDNLPNPPDAPDTNRRVALPAAQWVGVAIIAALPLLALFGVFGERWEARAASGSAIHVSVTYPTVFRYKMLNSIDLHVENRGTVLIDTVTVAIDSAYAARFSTVTAVPPFTSAWEVDLIALEPRETRQVRIEIQAEEYWRHSGELRVAADGDTVRIPLSTMIFP